MKKEYRARYGNFPFSDPLVICFSLFCLFSILGMFFYKECIIISLVNSFWVWRLASPYFEKFCLNNERIVTQKFKNREIIDIPQNVVLVLSYTIVEHSVSGKSCYTVNIVNEDTETVLKKLHEDDRTCEWIACRHRVKKILIYDNAYIENIFKNKVVYSFVYDKETQQIFNELKKTVILPRSLESKISIEQNGFDVIIDEGR